MIKYLRLVKFSHTIFALPFAMVGFFLGVLDQGSIDIQTLILVLLCMIFARNAAMSFNRWADRKIDASNPRTANREIPSGAINANQVLLFCIINVVLFVATTYFINSLCFFLSPVAMLVVLGYSYTKRFTSLAHFVLGMGLGLAPVGAYLALVGEFSLLPVLYGFAVFTWVAGFDIIYSLQDEGFDKDSGLFSIPSKLGAKGALRLSIVVHLFCMGFMVWAAFLGAQNYAELTYLFGIGTLLFLVLIGYQHSLVKYNDLSKVDLAFFKTNGIASLLFGLCFVLDVVVF